MASDTLPVLRRLTPQLTAQIGNNYSQLVVEHIRLMAKVYSAVSSLNLNDPEKAQETLQIAIAEYERSH